MGHGLFYGVSPAGREDVSVGAGPARRFAAGVVASSRVIGTGVEVVRVALPAGLSPGSALPECAFRSRSRSSRRCQLVGKPPGQSKACAETCAPESKRARPCAVPGYGRPGRRIPSFRGCWRCRDGRVRIRAHGKTTQEQMTKARRTRARKQVPKRCSIEQVQRLADRCRKTLAALGRLETDLRDACDPSRVTERPCGSSETEWEYLPKPSTATGHPTSPLGDRTAATQPDPPPRVR